MADADGASATYKNVRGLSRGLRVLGALNAAADGWSDPSELAEQVGLHRTTVRRILETLAAEGFVRRSGSDGRFRLTMQVKTLSEGFTDDEWISEVASPVLGQLLARVVWPSDLTTPDGVHMVVRETTHRFSPFSFHRSMIGKRLPMLFTASGRAYLAHCSERKRETVLHLLRQEPGLNGLAARASDGLQEMIAKTRERGYAINRGDWASERKMGAIAMPICRDDEPIGCVNVVYLTSGVSDEQAIDLYLPALKAAVDDMQNEFLERTGDQAPSGGSARPRSPAAAHENDVLEAENGQAVGQ